MMQLLLEQVVPDFVQLSGWPKPASILLVYPNYSLLEVIPLLHKEASMQL